VAFGSLTFAPASDPARTIEVVGIPAFRCDQCSRVVYDMGLQLLLEQGLNALLQQRALGPRIAFGELGITWPAARAV